MALPTAQQFADQWSKGMSGATEKMKAGINSVTEAPTMKAARRIDAMVAGVQRAAASGKTQAALEAVTVEDWRKQMLDKGVPRVASGAVAAKPKVAAFADQFIPWLQAGQRKLESMPRGDLETNLNRMMENARHNSQFRLQRR